SDPKEAPEEDDEDPKEDPTDYPDDRDDDENEEESSEDDVGDEEEDEDEDVCPSSDTHITSFKYRGCYTYFTTITTLSIVITTTPDTITTTPNTITTITCTPPPLPASPTYPLGYRAAMIRLRAKSPSTSHPLPIPSPIVLPNTRASMAMIRAAAPSTYILASQSETPPLRTPPLLPIPLPTPSPPLLLPSTVYRAGVSEPTEGFREDYGFVSTLDNKIRRDPKREVGYGIIDTWDKMVEDIQGTPATTDVAGLSQRMTDFLMTVRQDTNEIYGRLDDAQDDRSLMSGQLNMLCRDRCAHAHIARLMETEARLSREAWVQSMDASDTARSEVTALQSQQGPASGLARPEIPEEAGSSS
ncbi:hypothetical protein Tco_1511633, partial [Tanacetum coccineum]